LQALEEKGAGVAGLKKYDVEVNGVKTSVRLSEADAKTRGLLKPAPAKPAADADAAETKEAAAPLNKSRTAAKK
jgi:hypothetical protein